MFGIFANPMRFGDPFLYPSSFGFVQPFFHPMKRGFNPHTFLPQILQFERDNYGFFDDFLIGDFFGDINVFSERPKLLKDINNNNNIRHNINDNNNNDNDNNNNDNDNNNNDNDNNNNDNNNVPKKQPRIYEHHRKTVCDSATGTIKETEIERIDNKWVEKNIIFDKEGKKIRKYPKSRRWSRELWPDYQKIESGFWKIIFIWFFFW